MTDCKEIEEQEEKKFPIIVRVEISINDNAEYNDVIKGLTIVKKSTFWNHWAGRLRNIIQSKR